MLFQLCLSPRLSFILSENPNLWNFSSCLTTLIYGTKGMLKFSFVALTTKIVALATLKSLVGDEVMPFESLVGEGSFLPKTWVFYFGFVCYKFIVLIFSFIFNWGWGCMLQDCCSDFFLPLTGFGFRCHGYVVLIWYFVFTWGCMLLGYCSFVFVCIITICSYLVFMWMNYCCSYLFFWYKLQGYVLIFMLWVCCLVFFPSSNRACFTFVILVFFFHIHLGLLVTDLYFFGLCLHDQDML